MLCDRCFQPLAVGAHGLERCPFEPRRLAPAVWRDDIPGGVDIAHGLCHADGSPRRFYSRSAIRDEARAKGLVPWTEVYTEDRTKDARVHDDWLQSGEAQRARADRVAARAERAAERAR